MSRISQETEAEVVARLARGDGATEIATDNAIAVQSVYDIKARNEVALNAIRTKLLIKKEAAATRLVEKANKLLEQKLDDDTEYESRLAEIQMDYEASEKTEEDKKLFAQRLSALRKATVAELVSISREAFNQSQIEQNKPTSISASGNGDTRAELDMLLAAIASGDTVKLQQIVLNPKDD